MERDVPSIENDFKYQKLEWPIIRVFWVAMGLFLLLGILGVFGPGAFSSSEEKTEQFSITYKRYLRYSMSTEMVIRTKGLGKDSAVTINADFAKKVAINGIVPEPSSMTSISGRLKLKFPSKNIDNIVFYLEPIDAGNNKFDIEINGVKKVLHQYIYY